MTELTFNQLRKAPNLHFEKFNCIEQMHKEVSHNFLAKIKAKDFKKSKNKSKFKSNKPFDWLRLITQTIILLKLILEIAHHW